MSKENPNSCGFGAFDLNTLLGQLFAEDSSGNVGLKITEVSAECGDLTDLDQCATPIELEARIRKAVTYDDCGNLVLRVFTL